MHPRFNSRQYACVAAALFITTVSIRAYPQSITVTAPNGGEYWAPGSSQTITWTSTSVTGNVQIYLYNNWVKQLPALATIAATAGTWTWNIPAGQTLGSAYGIRVCSATNNAISDYSDGFFTIGPPPSITVTAPNGGEYWAPGSSRAITWTSTSITGNVQIYLYNNWIKQLPALTTIAATAGTWTWTIPAGQALGSAYGIRVCSATNNAISDYSDGLFTIGPPPSITVTAPTGGEYWQPGTSHAITWTSTSLTGNVQIYLYNNWTKVGVLAASVPITAGSWTWDISAFQDIGWTFRVRVQSLANTAISGYGNNVFNVAPPPSITVTAPNGGEVYEAGTSRAITWTCTSVTGNVEIFLYNNWVKQLPALATVAVTAGTWTWNISAGQAVGTKYGIRVCSASNNAISDFSDNFFSIVLTDTVLLPGNVPLTMVWIPPGSFMMGRNPGEQDSASDEDPQHQVTFASGFWIGKYIVTQAQWNAVIGSMPWYMDSYAINDPNAPAVDVTWNDAQSFVTALNKDTGLTFRLPSESQWEYACRAGTTTRFYWGDDPNYTAIGRYAWWWNNCVLVNEGHEHAVGLKLPNAWGLYDMIGNVSEYCQDWYHDTYTGAPVDGSAWKTPTGTYYVFRGNSWADNVPGDYRSAARGYGPGGACTGIGFRVCR